MKHLFNQATVTLALAAATLTFASCKSSENTEFSDEEAIAIATQFVDHTVSPTYSALAAKSELLVEQLMDLRSNPTDQGVATACETFLEARAEWEKSEAFLFGAASDFGIDPHIDSWPLDLDAFNNLMNSSDMLAPLAEEDGDEVAFNTLSSNNLGFHGIEYILFEGGHSKAASKITTDQLTYAVAVAGDLRNNCYRLEVSWIGDKAPKNHIEKLDDLEWSYTITGSDYSYGENIKKAGNAGSTYSSANLALISIIQGCVDIADEVGSSKINSAYALGDTTYIESPYSHMSITDFRNNIVSIRNVYYGGVEGQRDASKSLHEYVKKLDESLDAKVVDAIENAITKIDKMPAPFVENIHAEANGEAVAACSELSDALSEIADAMSKQ